MKNLFTYSDTGTGQCDVSDNGHDDVACKHAGYGGDKHQTVLLNNGQEMPLVGLGTAGFTDQELVSTAVDAALKHGYRLIGEMLK